MPHARRFHYVWLSVSCTPTYITFTVWRCKCRYHVQTSTGLSPQKPNALQNIGVYCEYCNKRFYLLAYAYYICGFSFVHFVFRMEEGADMHSLILNDNNTLLMGGLQNYVAELDLTTVQETQKVRRYNTTSVIPRSNYY